MKTSISLLSKSIALIVLFLVLLPGPAMGETKSGLRKADADTKLSLNSEEESASDDAKDPNKEVKEVKNDPQGEQEGMKGCLTDLETCYSDVETKLMEVESVNGELDTCTGDLDSVKVLHDACTKSSTDLKAEMATCNNTLNTCTGDLNSVNVLHDACKELTTDLKAEMATCNNTLNTCTGDLNSVNVLHDACKELSTDLKAEMATCNDSLNTCTGDLESVSGELNTCTKLSTDLNAKMVTCNDSLNDLKKSYGDCTSNLEALQDLETEMADVRAKYDSLQLEHTSCTTKLTDFEVLSTEVMKLEGIVKDISAKYNTCNNEATAHFTEVTNLKAQVTSLEAEVAELKSKHQSLLIDNKKLKMQGAQVTELCTVTSSASKTIRSWETGQLGHDLYNEYTDGTTGYSTLAAQIKSDGHTIKPGLSTFDNGNLNEVDVFFSGLYTGAVRELSPGEVDALRVANEAGTSFIFELANNVYGMAEKIINALAVDGPILPHLSNPAVQLSGVEQFSTKGDATVGPAGDLIGSLCSYGALIPDMSPADKVSPNYEFTALGQKEDGKPIWLEWKPCPTCGKVLVFGDPFAWNLYLRAGGRNPNLVKVFQNFIGNSPGALNEPPTSVSCNDLQDMFDEDECADATHKCAEGAICTNTFGGFTCECPKGYSGDGTTCTDIDECASGTVTCHKRATCFNTDGSYTCICDKGYSGDGTTCMWEGGK